MSTRVASTTISNLYTNIYTSQLEPALVVDGPGPALPRWGPWGFCCFNSTQMVHGLFAGILACLPCFIATNRPCAAITGGNGRLLICSAPGCNVQRCQMYPTPAAQQQQRERLLHPQPILPRPPGYPGQSYATLPALDAPHHTVQLLAAAWLAAHQTHDFDAAAVCGRAGRAARLVTRRCRCTPARLRRQRPRPARQQAHYP